ncbi:MAG TPA: hypothetical protein VKB86_00265 [Pyrinomonadaceae bacterium]|nr:hypothetical protein [Pyrinomonadaceae bacterium]
MATPLPTPAPIPLIEILPPIVEEEFDDMTDEELSELEMKLYYDSHDDREFWS